MTDKYPFGLLKDAMNQIEEGAGFRGGAMEFKDMVFMQKIEPEQPVIYHYTNWLDSNYEDEQVKFLVVMMCRKTPPNPKCEGE